MLGDLRRAIEPGVIRTEAHLETVQQLIEEMERESESEETIWTQLDGSCHVVTAEASAPDRRPGRDVTTTPISVSGRRCPG